jgi:hypothetical protein
MKTTETTTGPICCHKCGEQTPISTRLHTLIACKCGTVHAVIGLLVASDGDIPEVSKFPVVVDGAASKMAGSSKAGISLTVQK